MSAESNDHLQRPFSWFESVRENVPSDSCTLQEWVRIARSGDYRKTVDEIRREPDKERRSKLKKRLPAVAFSVCMDTRDKDVPAEDRNYQHSGILQIDVDLKDNPRVPMDEIRKRLMDHPSIIMVATSPSGAIKAACAIPAGVATHQQAFNAAKAALAKIDVKIDGKTHDVPRLCFLTHDPEAWLREGPVEVITITGDDDEDEEQVEKSKKKSDIKLSESKKSFPELTLHDLGDMLKAIGRPDDYNLWLHLCSGAWNHFGESATDFLAAHWPEEKQGEYSRKFAQRTEKHSIGTVIRHAMQAGWNHPRSVRNKVANLLPTAATISAATMPDLTAFDESDAGNAQRVFAAAGGGFHYVAESGKWILWNGSRWTPDRNGGMTRLHLAVMDATAHQAINMQSRQAGDGLAKYALLCRNASKVAAEINMLKAVSGVTISTTDLDADPWMIGTPDGMIDLKTGRPIAPDPSKLITKSIGTHYDENATCPTWEKVLETVTGADVELIQFLQSAVGYTLTGSNREQCLFFLYGLGCNGKGVFSETIKRLMGDYGQTAPESLFTKDRNQSATNDQARLAGCRMAIAAELEEDASFAESRIKALTGGDTITARFLHQEFFDFRPTHHFWISGNHKPTVKGSDLGIWRRLRLIPFEVTISAEQKDPDLADKLAEELPGILNWALEGCLRWQCEGLKTPTCVSRATEQYRSEEDTIGQFLAECTVPDRDERTLISTLYEAYQAWSEREGIKRPDTAKTFNRKLDERGMHRVKSHGGRFWDCISMT